MNEILKNLVVQTHSGLSWSDVKRQLTDWRQLEGLDDRCLEDIGMVCGKPDIEAAKRFWKIH